MHIIFYKEPRDKITNKIINCYYYFFDSLNRWMPFRSRMFFKYIFSMTQTSSECTILREAFDKKVYNLRSNKKKNLKKLPISEDWMPHASVTPGSD